MAVSSEKAVGIRCFQFFFIIVRGEIFVSSSPFHLEFVPDWRSNKDIEGMGFKCITRLAVEINPLLHFYWDLGTLTQSRSSATVGPSNRKQPQSIRDLFLFRLINSAAPENSIFVSEDTHPRWERLCFNWRFIST